MEPQSLARGALASLPDLELWQPPEQALSPKPILQTSAKSPEAPTSDALSWRDGHWVERLFRESSFSHLLELAGIDDASERAFYELHAQRER